MTQSIEGVQAEHESTPGIPRDINYYRNSWALIGLKDYPFGTRITPHLGLVLAHKRTLSFTWALDGSLPERLSPDVPKHMRAGSLPIVETIYPLDRGVHCQTSVFAAPMPGQPYDGLRTTERNYLNFTSFRFENHAAVEHVVTWCLELSGRFVPSIAVPFLLEGSRAGPGVVLRDRRGKVIGAVVRSEQAEMQAAGHRIVWTIRLPAQSSARLQMVFPFFPLDDPGDIVSLDPAEDCVSRTEEFWRDLLSRAAVQQLSDQKALDTYRASLVYMFLTRDVGEPRPGEGFYEDFWLRDAAFILYALEAAGFVDEASRSLPFVLARQREDGSFISQYGQLDGNGQALWALVQYWRFSRDVAWLRTVYPRLQRAVAWIRRSRRATGTGLLPNAPADGEFLWDGTHHIVGYDLWNLRGVAAVAEAAEVLGDTEEAETLEREFEDYRATILQALSKRGLDYFPPSYEGEGTHWSNLKVIYPTELLDPGDPLVTQTLERAEATFIEGIIAWKGEAGRYGGPVGLSAIHPYLSTFVTQSRLLRGECKVAEDQFDAVLAHTTSTHGFPEGVYHTERLAWNDTLPHMYGAANFVALLRRMLVLERRGRLELSRCLPRRWAAAPFEIILRGAPTEFGPLDLHVTGSEGRLVYQLIIPASPRLLQVDVYLPWWFQVNHCRVDGRAVPVADGRVPVHPGTHSVEVEGVRIETAPKGG